MSNDTATTPPAADKAGAANTRKVFIKTYGCQMNVYDSGRMADVLARDGYQVAETPEGADLVLSVSDAATGEELGRAPSVVGFSLESGTLVAYTRHGVQDIDLTKEGA